MSKIIRAWHFVRGPLPGTLRDGRAVQVGEWLEHEGPPELCASGYHASRRAIDALRYAPGEIVCRVDCGGEVIEDRDKLVCSRRRVLWAYDAADVLCSFARRCALDVIDHWDAPDVVVQYLRTGDESLRDAAEAAARDAAWAVARDAAWAAAEAAQAKRLHHMLMDGGRDARLKGNK